MESPFDMVRLRTNAARHYKRVENATAMIWELLTIAQGTWRTLKGSALLRDVYDETRFVDGQISKKVPKMKAVAA